MTFEKILHSLKCEKFFDFKCRSLSKQIKTAECLMESLMWTDGSATAVSNVKKSHSVLNEDSMGSKEKKRKPQSARFSFFDGFCCSFRRWISKRIQFLFSIALSYLMLRVCYSDTFNYSSHNDHYTLYCAVSFLTSSCFIEY